MKKILLPFLLSFIISANLEVEGGITATGEVQSPTIQSLLDQIAQLQEQINLLQIQLNESNDSNESNNTKSKVKILNSGTYSISDILPDITIDWALISLVKCYGPNNCGISDENYHQFSELFFRDGNYGFEEGLPWSHILLSPMSDLQLQLWSQSDDDRVKILVVYEEVSNE